MSESHTDIILRQLSHAKLDNEEHDKKRVQLIEMIRARLARKIGARPPWSRLPDPFVYGALEYAGTKHALRASTVNRYALVRYRPRVRPGDGCETLSISSFTTCDLSSFLAHLATLAKPFSSAAITSAGPISTGSFLASLAATGPWTRSLAVYCVGRRHTDLVPHLHSLQVRRVPDFDAFAGFKNLRELYIAPSFHVSGTTMGEFARVLREPGAAKVFANIDTLRYSCTAVEGKQENLTELVFRVMPKLVHLQLVMSLVSDPDYAFNACLRAIPSDRLRVLEMMSGVAMLLDIDAQDLIRFGRQLHTLRCSLQSVKFATQVLPKVLDHCKAIRHLEVCITSDKDVIHVLSALEPFRRRLEHLQLSCRSDTSSDSACAIPWGIIKRWIAIAPSLPFAVTMTVPTNDIKDVAVALNVGNNDSAYKTVTLSVKSTSTAEQDSALGRFFATLALSPRMTVNVFTRHPLSAAFYARARPGVYRLVLNTKSECDTKSLLSLLKHQRGMDSLHVVLAPGTLASLDLGAVYARAARRGLTQLAFTDVHHCTSSARLAELGNAMLRDCVARAQTKTSGLVLILDLKEGSTIPEMQEIAAAMRVSDRLGFRVLEHGGVEFTDMRMITHTFECERVQGRLCSVMLGVRSE